MAELTQERIEELAQKPKQASTDAGSATAHDLADVVKVADRKAAELDGPNENGGPKSAWHCLRLARASLPGAR